MLQNYKTKKEKKKKKKKEKKSRVVQLTYFSLPIFQEQFSNLI